MDTIIKIAEEQGMKLLGGIIVLAVGFFLVRWAMKFLTRNDHLTKLEPTVKGFFGVWNFYDLIRVRGKNIRCRWSGGAECGNHTRLLYT